MAEEKLERLDIVTPEKKIYGDDVRYVIAPGGDGELGILPEHAPILTTLRIGIMRVLKDGHYTRYAVSGGFLEARNSRVVVLADAAERAEDIDLERALAARERAEQRLAAKDPDVNLARAEIALKKAVNRIKAREETQTQTH